jgi:hypothetical protein
MNNNDLDNSGLDNDEVDINDTSMPYNNVRRKSSVIGRLPKIGKQKQNAQDKLLLTELENGLVPEDFINKSKLSTSVQLDLSHYGIGNKRAICLGKR